MEIMATLTTAFPDWGKPEDKTTRLWTSTYHSGASYLKDFQIITTSTDGPVKHICQQLVAAFDEEVAEPNRQAWRTLDETRKSLNEAMKLLRKNN